MNTANKAIQQKQRANTVCYRGGGVRGFEGLGGGGGGSIYGLEGQGGMG